MEEIWIALNKYQKRCMMNEQTPSQILMDFRKKMFNEKYRKWEQETIYGNNSNKKSKPK